MSALQKGSARASGKKRGKGKGELSRGNSFLCQVGEFFNIGRRQRRRYPRSTPAAEEQPVFLGAKSHPAEQHVTAAGLVECPVCCEEQVLTQFPQLIIECNHYACQGCLRMSLNLAVSEDRPACCLSCPCKLHPGDVNLILQEQKLKEKYEEFTLRRVLAADPDCRWCPAPDCKYAVIASGCASCPMLICEMCSTAFCYHCKSDWHPNTTCERARLERHAADALELVSLSSRAESPSEIKQCPRCATYITKVNDGSCNHMRCKMCAAEFCWLCRKEITDLHYLSPSGCTFWGKKPWSRKKKILWQLGTLVGAPLGIGLIAGIAIPAVIIGIPVWVGHRLRVALHNKNKHKRRLAVVAGVTGSLLISPLVAVLGVSFAVPTLLVYVYGVVPISLCRPNACLDDPESALDEQLELMSGSYPHSLGDSDSHKASASSDKPQQVRVKADVSPTQRAMEDTTSMESMERRSLSVHTVDTQDASLRPLCGSLVGPRDLDGKSIISILINEEDIEYSIKPEHGEFASDELDAEAPGEEGIPASNSHITN